MKWTVFALFGLMACAPRPDQAQILTALTPERVAGLQSPMILVAAPDIDVVATLQKVGQNGPVSTWQTRDGVQISLQAGLIVATRGLGHDVMAADVSSATRWQDGAYQRTQSRLDGNFNLVLGAQNCVMTSKGRKRHRAPKGPINVTLFEEVCEVAGMSVRNEYAIGADGNIWWSRQWINPQIGVLEVTLIRP